MGKRKNLTVGLIVTILSIGILLILLAPPRPEQTWTLPDGSVLRVLDVTWGTKHRFRYGDRWQDYFYPLVPAKFRTNFNFRVSATTLPAPGGLVIWLERSGATSLAAPWMTPECNLTMMDSNRVESLWGGTISRLVISPGTELLGIGFLDYPRRSKWLGLKIYFRNGGLGGNSSPEPVAEFRLPNQARRTTPVWPAETLPASRLTNGLEVRLASIETGLASWDVRKLLLGDAKFRSGRGVLLKPTARFRTDGTIQYRRFAPLPPTDLRSYPFGRAYTRLRLELRENGKPTTDWSVTQLEFSNAFGEVHPTRHVTGNGSDILRLDALWPEEPAWKVGVELSQTAGFRPEQLWKLKGIPVLAKGQIPEKDFVTNLFGVEIKLTSFETGQSRQGPYVRTLPFPFLKPANDFSDDLPSLTTDSAGACLFLQAPPTIWLTVVDLRDDQGRAARPQFRNAATASNRWEFGFSLPSGAKSLDVTFGVSQRRYVEFVVNPTLATSNAVPPWPE